jgi:hypothetical protein
MAVDTPSISRPLAPNPSLDYEQLFLQGLQHIEAMSGKIWTDYNAHDPGITMLEVLCYAITELGYRCDFELRDIIEPAPEDPILNNFFSLANVASNAPLTISDFRKLLIDIRGNRNAWLEKVIPATGVQPPADLPQLYYHIDNQDAAHLDYTLAGSDAEVIIKGLYDVYLQFEEHPEFGDLNDNSLSTVFYIKPIGKPAPLPFDVEVEFPIWEKIPAAIESLYTWVTTHGLTTTGDDIFELKVNNFTPSTAEEFVYDVDLKIKYGSGLSTSISLPLHVRVVSGQEAVLNLLEFQLRLREQIDNQFYEVNVTPGAMAQLVLDFLDRREVIKALLLQSNVRLADHRNLCEDFHNIYPMSLQEIGLALELDLEPGTDSEAVMAEVYYLTEQYLSPTIRFYSLREMLEKGYTPEEIFRGPWLINGFIDENDLAFYQRREILYTSDLVQAFMKIAGVRAINYIAFSRYKEGQLAMTGTDLQQNLEECLCLDNPSRYLPRLNYTRSNILVDAGAGRPLPPDRKRALELLGGLKALDKIKGEAGQGDFTEPRGIYSNLEEYHSIQHEFPINYAIGIEGLAPNETVLRKAQAQQLKGYLLFFEQLLANFHSQLSNLRKLFSYDADIDRTYFTQALYNVPRVKDLIKDFTEVPANAGAGFDAYMAMTNPGNPALHYRNRVDDLAETEEIFQDRRKRFLDHLLGRFNESFSEYAAYVFSRNMPESAQYDRLIEDQARFLRQYVLHSHDRATAFNYRKYNSGTNLPNPYWRASLATESLNLRSGEPEALPVEDSDFVDPFAEFDIYQDKNGKYRFRLYDANGANMLYAAGGYNTLENLKTDLTAAIGFSQERDLSGNLINFIGSVSSFTLQGTPPGIFASYGIVGPAFIKSYYEPNTPPSFPVEALEALAGYLKQLITVDTLPVETAKGNSIWQEDNDVTGLKKRMVFLTGLPNVNREFINPFERFEITGTVGSYTFRLLDDDDVEIYTSALTFATEDDARSGMLVLLEQLPTLDVVDLGATVELWTPSTPGPATLQGTITADYRDDYNTVAETITALTTYLAHLYHIENLHVVEHILLRPRQTGALTLDVRHDNKCKALDIIDPYSFRITVVLPHWAGRFAEMDFRTMFKRLMRAEAPAHVYIHFMWLDPLQMYCFEHCWADWLQQDWSDADPQPSSDDFITCFNKLCNQRDAYYVLEPFLIKSLYENCSLLAAPYDPDGDIIKAWLAPGSSPLPPGTCLNPCNGEIRVNSLADFTADPQNDFDLHINTINAGGEEACHDVVIQFVPNGSATSNIHPVRDLCYFNTLGGDMVLVEFTDSNPIVQAIPLNYQIASSNLLWPDPILGSGTLIAGMAIDPEDGTIIVSNPTTLVAGTYNITVELTDSVGGVTILTVAIVVNPDKEATYTTNMPPLKSQDAYAAGDVLATITDLDGLLVSVVPAIGQAPLATLGLELDPLSGAGAAVNVRIASASDFAAALTSSFTLSAGYYTYTLKLRTADNCNGFTDLEIPLSIRKDTEANFVGVPVKNVSLHNVNSLVGSIYDVNDGGLVSTQIAAANVILAPLGLTMTLAPAALAILVKHLEIRVSNKALFTAAINAAPSGLNHVGTITATLPTQDTTGGLSNVVMIVSAIQDQLPIITYVDARNVDTYVLNEVLATIEDMDGTGIVSATHVPTGFTLASIGLKLVLVGGYIYVPPQDPMYMDEEILGESMSGNFRMGNSESGNMKTGNSESGNMKTGNSGPGAMTTGMQPTSGFGLNAPQYQMEYVPNYYQPPTPKKAQIQVANVALFRQGVNFNPVYTVIDQNTHRVMVPIKVNTVDSMGGVADNLLEIEILQDVEATATPVMNGARINTLQFNSVLYKFEDPDPNTIFQSATIMPPPPAGLTFVLQGSAYVVRVSNTSLLTTGSWPVTVSLVDNQGGQSQFNVTLSILPKLVTVNFTVEASQQSHILDLDTKVPGLVVSNWIEPLLPKTFGTLFLNDGIEIGFSEGSAFTTSTYTYGVRFNGTLTETGPLELEEEVVLEKGRTSGLEAMAMNSGGSGGSSQVDGILYISRKIIARSPNTPVDVRGIEVMAGNALINSETTKSNASLKTLANETGKVLGKLQDVTYYPDNPLLRQSPETLEAYANGAKDIEMAASLETLAVSSGQEILRLQDEISLGGANVPEMRQALAVQSEVLKMQVLAAVQFAGNIRSADIDQSAALQDLFGTYQDQLAMLEAHPSTTMFPELSSLRKTLFELQTVYAVEKPALDTAIASLQPKMRHSQLSALEAKLPSPFSGESDAELLTQLAGWRAVFEQVEALFADSAFVVDWQKGVGIDQVVQIYSLPSKYLIDYIFALNETLSTLTFGTRQIDTRHFYQCAVDLLMIGVNSIFELFDLLPGNEESRELPVWLQAFSEAAKPISSQPALAEFRNLITSWMAKWPLRTPSNASLEKSLTIATLEMLPIKSVDAYVTGDVLAEVHMHSGTLSRIALSQGLLPLGISLNDLGQIVISDPSKLMIGFFDGFELEGANDRGFTFLLPVPEIELSVFDPPVYIVLAPQPIENYLADMKLASPMVEGSKITAAQVVEGDFPPGVRFNTELGIFSVAKPAKLKEGTYSMKVATEDERGSKAIVDVTIVIGSDEPMEGPPIMRMLTLPLQTGTEIAAIEVPYTVTATSITQGFVPEGLEVTQDGRIIVKNGSILQAGRYNFTILATTAGGPQYLILVSIMFTGGSAPLPGDPLDLLGITLPRPTGEVLGMISIPHEIVVSTTINQGMLPDGVVNTPNGEFVVIDGEALMAGMYVFEVYAQTSMNQTYAIAVRIEFVEGSGVTYLPPMDLGRYTIPQSNGKVFGTIVVPGQTIVSTLLYQGSLPLGVELTSEGVIRVSNSNNLMVEALTFEVHATIASGLVYGVVITLELLGTVGGTLPVRDLGKFILPRIDGEVLTSITIENETILSLTINNPVIPQGLQLTAAGELRVQDAESLVTGIYQLMLYPETELDIYELQITFDIVEGLPALNLGQFILPRTTGELLGTITIPNETVSTASVHAGELPEGVSLSATGGGFLVSDPQLLSDGTSTFEVYATSVAGVLYTVTVTVEFVEVIQLSPLDLGQFILPRTNNEVLGTIVIPNETINATSLHSGALPTGVVLTAIGEIKVDDAQLLEDGDATFIVRAWTVSGLLHEVTVSIELVEVIQLSPLDLGQFILPRTNNEVLGTIVIPNETINATSLHSGALPTGVILTATGEIRVEDAQLLEDGDTTFVVRAWTVSGLLHEVTVSIELVEVIQLSPLDLGEFILPRTNNEVLGTIVIPNETINATSLHSGALPTGVILTATGQIKVEDAQLLEDGDATFVVRAWTVSGLLHEISVSIALIEVIELSPLDLGRFILPLANDQLLGTIVITNQTINATSIYEGTVPAGVIVTSTGQIRVQDAQLLEPVEASFVVHAATVSGLLYAITVSVELAEATAISPIDLGQYLLPGTNGDLAGVIIIPNETVSATTVHNGEVPAGLVLGSNGELRVSVAGDLVIGTYSFDVYVDTTSGLLLDVTVTIELDDVTILAPLDFGQRTLPQPDETVLGTVTYTGITFTGFELVTGPMPDGTTVLQTGQFVVIESGAMQAGNYRFTMAGFDGAGDVYHFDIIIELVTD